ncbi:MAG TPA: TIGR00159 family protein [Candidatus Ornithomonoglobus merdipullorum]|uniref:Diadenylate cyclase n=1 Tax=Candidatus Ornithomonoglobus merdipullorum TaxID=2840895 RepID=A0A9D1SDX7_9FIRM|nr:TIGR00159 family protein [Candidatus Ornithomonoglobus merdipullorum]
MDVFGALNSFFEYAFRYIRILRISDFVDIFIVAVIVYYIMMSLRGTRAVHLLKGIIVAVVIFMLSSILHLNSLNYILGAVFQIAMYAVVVIFQPELRNLLEKMGRLRLGSFMGLAFNTNQNKEDMETVILNIAAAAADMSETKTGALIVIERETRLGEYMPSGTVLDANVTRELLENIFVPNTPLHDGAVIIRGSKIITAGCVLPLTANTNLSSELGTRHRAALGLSETSDAIVVVVSEETGKISIALNGALTRNLNETTLRKALTKLLSAEPEKGSDTLKKIKFWKSK